MRPTLLPSLRSLTACGAALLLGPALAAAEPAAGEDLQIARMGNLLIVTAPESQVDAVVAARLAQKVTCRFEEAPLADAVEFLRQATGLNMVVAPAVATAGKTVTLAAQGMEARSVLTWLTRLTDTAVEFVDGAVYLHDGTATARRGATRVYDVSDLVLPIQDFPGKELAYTSGEVSIFSEPAKTEREQQTPEAIEELIRRHVQRR